MSLHVKVQQKGYLYVYLSNEQPVQTNVYFDDLKITHNTNIEQIAEYYPFGLQQGSNSFARTGSTNNPLTYNGKELQDELNLGWLDYGARMYMSDIARWGAFDPLAETSRRWSPYNYAMDNPMRFIDPDGMSAEESLGAWMKRKDAEDKARFSGRSTASRMEQRAAQESAALREEQQAREQQAAQESSEQQAENNVEAEQKSEAVGAEVGHSVGEGGIGVHGEQQRIPGLTIEFGRNFSMDNSGVDIRLSYKNPNNDFSEYGWIQTVRTNSLHAQEIQRGVHDNEPFNDGRGDGMFPYYGGPTSYNSEGFDTIMADHPGRPSNSAYVTWRAEVTIGGIRDGVFVPIGTLTYGFDIIDGKLDVYYPRVSEPSPWHVDSFTNKSKW